MKPETKQCQSCKKEFMIEIEDFEFYDKIKVLPARYCPDCRFKRRATWRNERTLYKRVCGLCGKSVITMHNPKMAYPVYCNECWASDKWDPKEYGRKYDLARPFFDQLHELIAVVPQSATYSSAALGPNVGSEYSNFAGGNKNGYLVFNSGPGNENISYSRGLLNCRDTFDTYFGDGNERVFEGINIWKSTGVVYGQNVNECLDSWLLMDCSACSSCFGCVNLRYGQYQFFNEKLSKDEYLRRVGEIAGSYSKLEEAKRRFNEHVLKFPRRQNQNNQSVNSTGDYLIECKDCYSSFEVSNSENIRYGFFIKKAKDCMDMLGHCRNSELLLEGVGVGSSQRVIGSWWVENAHDIAYSLATRSSDYCFGCVSLKGAKYCILNYQYSEEEYKEIAEHIIDELIKTGEYGSFLPPKLSFFAYNETVGQDNIPVTKQQAIAEGFRWEGEIPATRGSETVKPENIPDNIRDVQDSFTSEVLACTSCARNSRLTSAELSFYKQMLIPVPRACWQCRFEGRIRRRGPMKLFDRKCAKCGIDIKTGFSPDMPEIVYCEKCYQLEVA